ncbi:MAG: hypothetical protein KC492_23750, partial [Myxococcales bacterium]|nr:hypothetical protein [Myxococcales bacterium]
MTSAGELWLWKALLGVAIMLGALGAFWWYLMGNPVDELALLRRAEVSTGRLVDTIEDEAEDNRGRVGILYVGVYSFRLPDGQTYKASTKSPSNEFPQQASIEYLPG